MADLMRRTYTVTLEVTVSVREIDDELVAATHRGFNNDVLANDPDRAEWIARDRRLLTALLEHPDLVGDLLRRHVASSLSELYVRDDSLEGAGMSEEAEGRMVEGLRAALPPDDYQFLHDVCAEGYFFDNTVYFQDAFSTRLARVRIREADEREADEREADEREADEREADEREADERGEGRRANTAGHGWRNLTGWPDAAAWRGNARRRHRGAFARNRVHAFRSECTVLCRVCR